LKFLLSAVIAFWIASCVFAESSDKPMPAPSAQQLVDDMLARLPAEPLTITGDIILRKRHGVVLRELKFQMILNWGDRPATARYVIMDAFGAKLEELLVSRENGQLPQFNYSAADSSRNSQSPDLSVAIQDTDISWLDLTLSFLWWKAESIVGKEEIRGRPCYIVEVRPPLSSNRNAKAPSADAAQVGQYAKAHLWLDEKLHMLLQAQGFDSEGKIVRSLWIKSFKRINDRWMIKDMEIQSSELHRTKLLIHDMEDVNNNKEPES
jgi:hypothetical protein